jgi:hypothetical protein
MLRQILKAACLAPLALLLCQCDALMPRPKVSPYASTVRMAFTPMALAKMNEIKDNFVLVAYYYGDPTPQALKKADELGRLNLGEERYAWTPNARTVHLDGPIDVSLLPQIRGPVQALITAYSATPIGAADDLIHCTTWIGTIKELQAHAPLIACELDNNDKDSADDIVAADQSSSSE